MLNRMSMVILPISSPIGLRLINKSPQLLFRNHDGKPCNYFVTVTTQLSEQREHPRVVERAIALHAKPLTLPLLDNPQLKGAE